MGQENQVRNQTEVTKANRRAQTEVTVGNRRMQTEVTVCNRRTEGQNIYSEVWKSENATDETDLLRFIQQIQSAVFRNQDCFQRAAEKLQSLTGYSGRKYQVAGSLPEQGGESVVLLCRDESGTPFAAKIYRDLERIENGQDGDLVKIARVRSAVIEFSRSEEAKGYVLPICDVGLISFGGGTNNYFEIQPYCEKGDLSKRKAMTFEELLPLIAHLNEALKRIHLGGLLHLDIKPENLYEYQGEVVISDFGIAHIQKDGRQVTQTGGGTMGYRAPETVFAPSTQNAAYYLTTAADYYSLAVTLASLYAGHYIYEGIEGDLPICMRESHIPLPLTEDANQIFLQNLIDGLYQFDSQYRFGYEEVNTWLQNHHFRAKTGNLWPRPYNFDKKICNNEYEFHAALSQNWELGKQHLYRKYIEQFFASFRPEIAQCAYEIVEIENADVGDDANADFGFCKFLINLCPNGWMVWKNRVFEGLSQVAEEIISSDNLDFFQELLKKRVLSMWLEGKEKKEPQVLQLVREIEKLAESEPEMACCWFGYAFSEKKELEYLGQNIKNAAQFLQEILRQPQQFYEEDGVLETLTDLKKGARVYGFLYSKGYQSVIEAHLNQMKSLEPDGKAEVLFHMLDEMAMKMPGKEAERLAAMVRTFYREFGPMGYLVCLKDLVRSKRVYAAKNNAGKELLRQLAEMVIPEQRPIAEMAKEMKKLADAAWQMRSQMQNNPFLTELGMLEDKMICCQELEGFFSYEFLGRLVPLKFESILRGKGGKPCEQGNFT